MLNIKTVKAYREDWEQFPDPWKGKFQIYTKGAQGVHRDVMKAVMKDEELPEFCKAIGATRYTRTFKKGDRIIVTAHPVYEPVKEITVEQ